MFGRRKDPGPPRERTHPVLGVLRNPSGLAWVPQARVPVVLWDRTYDVEVALVGRLGEDVDAQLATLAEVRRVLREERAAVQETVLVALEAADHADAARRFAPVELIVGRRGDGALFFNDADLSVRAWDCGVDDAVLLAPFLSAGYDPESCSDRLLGLDGPFDERDVLPARVRRYEPADEGAVRALRRDAGLDDRDGSVLAGGVAYVAEAGERLLGYLRCSLDEGVDDGVRVREWAAWPPTRRTGAWRALMARVREDNPGRPVHLAVDDPEAVRPRTGPGPGT